MLTQAQRGAGRAGTIWALAVAFGLGLWATLVAVTQMRDAVEEPGLSWFSSVVSLSPSIRAADLARPVNMARVARETPTDDELQVVEGIAVEVVVLDPRGVPLPGTTVHIGAKGMQLRGITDDRGQYECQVQLAHLPICEVSALSPRSTYAWYRENLVSRDAVVRREGRLRLTLQLQEGGSVRARVVDAGGRPIEDQLVHAYYAGEEDKTRIYFDRSALSDAGGVVELAGLEPGAWDVSVPRWKAHEAGGTRRVIVCASDPQDAGEFRLIPIAREAYASGAFRGLAGEVDEFGRLVDFSLERSDGSASDLFVYRDGSFFVYAGSPDLRIRLLSKLDRRSGPWLPLPPGVHLGALESGL